MCALVTGVQTCALPISDGDERRYVDALIRKLGVRLDAPTYNLGAVDVTRAVLPHFPLPYAAHFFQAIAAEPSRIEATEPVTAYFSGNGGGNVFCSLNSAAPLADRLLANRSDEHPSELHSLMRISY